MCGSFFGWLLYEKGTVNKKVIYGSKITLKGNGSFYIREGWLTKGLVEIEKNPELFSKKYFEGAEH